MRFRVAILLSGAVALAIASVARPSEASVAAFATWRPFVLVTGLLLVGFVANENGLFDALGRVVARSNASERGFVVGALLGVAAVTALLNLDTAAAFVTPVLVVGARQRGMRDDRLLYGTLLMCNAASLLLPGSNLTNLLVLSSEHRSGAHFLGMMWPAFVGAVAVTLLFVAFMPARRSDAGKPVDQPPPRTAAGAGAVAIAATTATVVLVLAFHDPAPFVLAAGVAAAVVEVMRDRARLRSAIKAIDPAVVAGLFAIATALGTLGRSWDWPARQLRNASAPATAAVAAGASVVLNNLPTAALFAARPIAHPRALLVGLNLGPNLAVTGSLSALLWYRTARAAGARPNLMQVTRLGVVLVPLSVAAALLALHGA